MKKCFIAIGPYCWGRADTIDKAIANAKKAKATFIKEWTCKVYECHPTTTVEPAFGGLTYPKAHPPKEVTQ